MNGLDGTGFYVIDENDVSYPHESADPVAFDQAIARAEALTGAGHAVRVLYTEGASPEEIASFTNRGILAELVSTG